MRNLYWLLISAAASCALGGAAGFGALAVTALRTGPTPALGALMVIALAAAGFGADWYGRLVHAEVTAEAESLRAMRAPPPLRPRPAVVPQEILAVVSQLGQMTRDLGHLAAHVVEAGHGLAGLIDGMAEHVAATEAERDTLRHEAAKVREIASIAQRSGPRSGAMTPELFTASILNAEARMAREETERPLPAFLQQGPAPLEFDEIEEGIRGMLGRTAVPPQAPQVTPPEDAAAAPPRAGS